MLPIGLIYCATNKVNGKKYIGQTRNDFKIRKARHKSDRGRRGSKFQTAIGKYGWDNFEWEVLEDGIELSNLTARERHFIKHYDSYLNGYNGNEGGSMYKRGEDNSQSKYSINLVKKVIKDVEENKMKNEDIAVKHSVPISLVSSITKGESYTYMWDYGQYEKTRDVLKFKVHGEKHWRNKYTDEEWVKVKEEILNTKLTLREISKKNGISLHSVQDFSDKKIKKYIWGEDANTRMGDKIKPTKGLLESIFKDYYVHGVKEVDIVRKYEVSRGLIRNFIVGGTYRKLNDELKLKYKGEEVRDFRR